jgi:PAP2 superfamily
VHDEVGPIVGGPVSRRVRHGWILEVAVGAAVYLGYDWLRDKTVGTSAAAFRNARQIVRAEKFLGLYHEHSIQQAFLSADWFMAFWNIYYGTIHFVMPVVALVWMYRKAPVRYVRWRNTIVLMLAMSLLVFWLYPLMPPRLMPSRYGFVDAAAHFFNFGPQVHVRFGPDGQPTAAAVRAFGNLYAAMPSLHVGWSTWCDAVGGWVVLALGYLGALAIERAQTRRRQARGGEPSNPLDATVTTSS